MNLEIKAKFAGSRVKKLVLINEFFSGALGKMLSILLWLSGLGVFAIWSLFIVNFGASSQYLGLDQILLSFFLVFIAVRSFLRFFVKNPQIQNPREIKDALSKNKDVNIVNCFSVNLSKALMEVGDDLEESNTGEILASVVKSDESNFIFARLGRAKDEILKQLSEKPSSSGVRFSTLAEQALEIAIKENHDQVEIGDFLVVLAEADLTFSSYLSSLNLSRDDLGNIVYWQTTIQKKIDESRLYLDPKYLRLTGGIGKDWAYGYTPELDRYSIDITESIENGGLGLELIGHNKEIKKIIENATSTEVLTKKPMTLEAKFSIRT